eukprot:CAMPEP_0116070038 /NCGR_PEP_ID=MMETSP0322-20121206/12733_1 /TAXON_ID=163516 /ORGANISM="Leptocylindrus danicus var. apora, Strain B651" /LENGTH=217 /DNA_ID=CAMNT_0003557693 /DNA_START=66 /DNA_END=716 /DNA_ORIENTATION=+
MTDIVSLVSDTVPQHPVPRPSTVNAFASELMRGLIYSAFDSDSYRIGIDSMASACMSPFLEDFVPETLRPFTRKSGVTLFGKGPSIPIPQMGTIKWSFDDDTSRKHVIFIENSLYVPDGSERLISLQHWARPATHRAYMASTKPAFLQHCGAMEHAICYAANHHHQVPSTFEGKMDVIPWCQTEYKDENLSDFNSEVPQATNNVTEPDEHTSATTRS